MRLPFKLDLKNNNNNIDAHTHSYQGGEQSFRKSVKIRKIENVPISGNMDRIPYQPHLKLPSRIVLNLIMKDYKRDDV